MKKIFFLFLILAFSVKTTAQLNEATDLTEKDMEQYAVPFVTSVGTWLNSGGYHSASVSKMFGVKISLLGMVMLIPDDQLTFKLKNGTETATVFGDKGASVPGTNGYLVYPPGFNQNKIPAAIPQIAVSTLGSELMLRFFPKTSFDSVNVNLLGIGVKHSISQYIPLCPVDIAVQVMYNTISMDNNDFDLSTKNWAFNAHVSRSFGLFSVYGGLQYEQSQMNINYVYTGNALGGLLEDKEFSVDMKGDNKMRITVGAALRFAFFVINADASLGAQNVFVTGINFEF
ncbi:MAG: hypothetical protein CR986_04085 [Ignavibacteriae bacterium]|nr:MAG: hypothetical protein CR986_04085 [Ignavibacteriota bacterium]